jgi:exodeoxyribonuclease V gamma subunit
MIVVPHDFRLTHGNDLEVLAAILAGEIARAPPGGALLAPETILIPQPAMRRWLQKTLAEAHGIAANLRFLTPGEFVRQTLDANLPDQGETSLGDAGALRWRLWSVLMDPAARHDPVFAPLQAVLADADPALSAWTLAGELAQAFEKYQAWRRDWLRRWDHGGDRHDWQAELWRRATRGLHHRGQRLDRYFAKLDAGQLPIGLPPRLFAFGCQNVSPDVLRVIASAARAGTLHFYFLSPVAGWWGDLVTARERRRRQSDVLPDDDEENPLLAANGGAGRDFVNLIFADEQVQPTWEQGVYEPPDPARRTGLLHALQRELLARQAPPRDAGTRAVDRDDRSLQVHSCHTRLREVQVLHEQLRDLLENNPGLAPRDIAVLTPRIDDYAPHVQAVFGGDAASALAIPYALADGSAIAEQPLADAFLRLLALPTARFTANEVLELLSLPAIAERFGLEPVDGPILREWLHAAGARWGLSAEHRQALAAPREAAYTWAWALDRLLLGHASGDEEDILGVAPLARVEGGDLPLLDALLQGLRALARWQQRLGRAVPADRWQAQLQQMIGEVFAERPSARADQRAIESLRAQVERFARETRDAGSNDALPPAVVRSWFQSALSESDHRQPLLSGGVTFAQMVPMRLIPFKVICLLGMDDTAFPRRDPAGSLNRLSAQLGTAQRRRGDRSVRDDDRLLFLQLFAAATEVFYLSYLGRDPRSDERRPPSVVVAELLEVAARHGARDLVVEHPLQPFAPEAFGRGDARRVSYHAGWRAAAGSESARLRLPRFASSLPSNGAATPLITREQLQRVLSRPARAFLLQGLGLRLPRLDERLPDSEPFANDDPLPRHALQVEVFKTLAATPTIDPDALRERMLARALVAPGEAGAMAVSKAMRELRPFARQWRAWSSDEAGQRRFELDVDGTTIAGALAPVHANGLLQLRVGKPHGRNRLTLGIDALLWSAWAETRPVHRLITGQGGGAEILAPLPREDATSALRTLLAVYQQALEAPLPFMPKTGFVYAQAMARHGDDDRAWAAAEKEWRHRDGIGDGDDPEVKLALRGCDPFDDPDGESAQRFRELSRTIFATMLSADAEARDD